MQIKNKMSNKKLSIPVRDRIKHRSTGKTMDIMALKNCVSLVKDDGVYKIKKEGDKFFKVRKSGKQEVVYELSNTEMKKFGRRLSRIFKQE